MSYILATSLDADMAKLAPNQVFLATHLSVKLSAVFGTSTDILIGRLCVLISVLEIRLRGFMRLLER